MDLEARIDAAWERFVADPTKDNWQALADLIWQRTPERVAEMERAKGLRG